MGCNHEASRTLIFSFGEVPGDIWAWNLSSLAPLAASKATS